MLWDLHCGVAPSSGTLEAERGARRGPSCSDRGQLEFGLNAYAERFVRSIKKSCLERLILFGERSLRTAAREFVLHYLKERHHQGLGNQLIIPEAATVDNEGSIECRQRLGGMLKYYCRSVRRCCSFHCGHNQSISNHRKTWTTIPGLASPGGSDKCSCDPRRSATRADNLLSAGVR